MNNKKAKIGSTIIFGVVVIVICILFAVYSQMGTASALFSICFERSDGNILLPQDADWYGSDELRAQQSALAQAGLEALGALAHSEISFSTSSAGARYIRGDTTLTTDYYDAGSDRTAVLLHAYGRSQDFALRWAEFWVERGYNILIPQMRGHDGNDSITVLGFYEQYDLYDLLNAVQAETGVQTYALHGEGMGANAALLMCGNSELMANLQNENTTGITIELVVAESASTDLTTLVTYQADRQFEMSGVLERFVMKFTIRQVLGFSPDDMDVVEAVSLSSTPTVFICGTDDGFSPDEWTQSLYDACAAEKVLLLAEGVSHSACWERTGDDCAAAIESLLP